MFRAALALAVVAGCDARIGVGLDADAAPAVIDAAGGPEPEPDAAQLPPDAAPDARLPCEEGDQRIEDPDSLACYMLFLAQAGWAEAQEQCAALGGHLAAVKDLAENAFLSQIAPPTDIWIGATDEGSEGLFRWVTGEPFDFTHWREGEPNNGGDDGENCAVAEGENDVPGEGCLWDDRACDEPRPYLCERG